jgi:hypothetical protein
VEKVVAVASLARPFAQLLNPAIVSAVSFESGITAVRNGAISGAVGAAFLSAV